MTEISSKVKLKRNMVAALVSIIVMFVVCMGTTFAWYIYNTGAHTTKLHMAAGTSPYLQISSSYEGPYSSNTVLDSFSGQLTPVSTNRIQGGFQKVKGFIETEEEEPRKLAAIFGAGEYTDYYRTSLFIKATGSKMAIGVADIGFEDSSSENPISTAIRVGFVVHYAGLNMPIQSEYIFSINAEKNPKREYNTITGVEGWVLDSAKNDGTTIEFTPYSKDNYCVYDRRTGTSSFNDESIVLAEIAAASEPVEVEIYIWLEGCDEDCTINLGGTNLDNIALSFAGVVK